MNIFYAYYMRLNKLAFDLFFYGNRLSYLELVNVIDDSKIARAINGLPTKHVCIMHASLRNSLLKIY